MTFSTSIIEYLGTVEGGVLCLIGIMWDGKFYEGTFYYNEKDIILTISDEMEGVVGDVKKLKQYPDLLRSILSKIIPFSEIYDRLDPVDFARWVDKLVESEMKNPNFLKNRNKI